MKFIRLLGDEYINVALVQRLIINPTSKGKFAIEAIVADSHEIEWVHSFDTREQAEQALDELVDKINGDANLK